MDKPLITIIIPTKNVEQSLEKCLKSIKKQIYKNIEIIVVDNYSKDKTFNIANKYTKKVFLKGPERSAQRNLGAKKSRGEYIAWFDADMFLDPNVINDCSEKMKRNSNISALIIPERSVGVGFWAKCKTLEKRCYLGDEKIEGIRFLRKDVFNKVGKLAENLISGEDWDITARVRDSGYQIDRITSYVNHDEGNLSLISDLKKKFYYATKSLPYVDKHIQNPTDVILFVFRPAFLRNWRILLEDPLVSVGLFVLKFSEFFVGTIGVLYAKIFTSNKIYEKK